MNRHTGIARIGYVLLLLGASLTSALGQTGFEGDWVVTASFDETPHRLKLTKTQDSFQGKLYGTEFTGTEKSDRVEFRISSFLWTGKRMGDTVSGEILQDGKVSAEWSARRLPAPKPPRTYQDPVPSYSRLFTAAATPMLRLRSGDTVRTKTLDAGGNDENSQQKSRGGNPLTGPFYVEGALPGDTLVVKLIRVETNRDWAFSGRALVDSVLDPDYIRNRTFDRPDNAWRIDKQQGIVSLLRPTERLAHFTAPLAPFLGCLGVAPSGGASIRTTESGAFGGNMEYRQIRSGARVFLPVLQEGAYLYLGDGHAAQGDGEIAGDALETSMDVEFTIEVLPAREQALTRVENEEAIMSVGVSTSLEQAVRAATSDMARWLEKDYKLTSAETALLLGVAMQYDLADMVPPQFTCVARLSRSAIQQIQTGSK